MSTYRKCLAAGLLWIVVALAGAQDSEAPPSPPANPPANPPASPPRQPPAETREAPRPAQPSDAEDVFIPTEEVQADEELAFPVDI